MSNTEGGASYDSFLKINPLEFFEYRGCPGEGIQVFLAQFIQKG